MSSPHEQGDNTNQQGESSNQLPLDSFSNDQPQMGWPRDTTLPQVHHFERLIVNDLTGSEPQDEYVPGGYYNVKINSVIDSKYRIIRKIGWGAYSTVYMAKDIKENEYLAFKFTKSDELYYQCSMKEIEFLKAMEATDQTSTGANHVVRMKDWFTVEGENGGIHLVMGLEMLGPSVFNVMNNSNQRMFHLDNVRKLCRQLLEAVSFLHDECRIIHGDIKPENIMLVVSQQDIQRVDPFVSQSNIASYGVDIADPNCEILIKLGDFGCSRFEDQPTTRLVQTCNYRAPEVFLKAGFDKEADIWSVGCVLYELITGELLFTCIYSPDQRTHEIHHLTQISEYFGPIMAFPFLKDDNMQYLSSIFKPNGKLMNQQEYVSDSLSRKMMNGKRIISKEDVNAFIKLLQLILNLNPKNRPSAKCLLMPLGWFALPDRAHEEQLAPVDEVHNLLDVMDNLHISSEKQ